MKNRSVLYGILIACLLFTASAVRAQQTTIATDNASPESLSIAITFTGDWNPDAQAAVEFAASKWENLLNSPSTIEMEVYWSDMAWLPANQPAYATVMRSQSDQHPHPIAWYPSALSAALLGEPGSDFQIAFNSAVEDWYFGLDGQPPAGDYDLVTVALKYIGIALGLDSSFSLCGPSGQLGCWGDDYNGTPYPYVYDLFVENGAGQSLTDTNHFDNPSEELHDQLKSGDIYFNGEKAIEANGGTAPKLYAPADWTDIRNPLLLDEATYPAGTANALMTAILEPGEAIHEPGPLALAMLLDLGWHTEPEEPFFASIGDIEIPVNSSNPNIIDLWQYIGKQYEPEQVAFSIVSNSAPAVGISIDGVRYISITPQQDWVGVAEVVIEAKDDILGKVEYSGLTIWVVSEPPVLNPIPEITVPRNSSLPQAVDLTQYVSDPDSPPEQLTFSLFEDSDWRAGLSINGQYLSIEPIEDWVGSTTAHLFVRDLQWNEDSIWITVHIVAEPPVLLPIPDLTIPANQPAANAINVWDYLEESSTPPALMTFTITDVSAPEVGLTFDGTHISFQPEPDWTGSSQITIEVEDDTGQTDSTTFTVNVVQEQEPEPATLFLPLLVQ